MHEHVIDVKREEAHLINLCDFPSLQILNQSLSLFAMGIWYKVYIFYHTNQFPML
jgi:hypothetical protein